MDDGPGWATGQTQCEYWVNLTSGEVEEGRLSPVANRMGPYATRRDAEHAFEKAAERTALWDEEDRRRKEDGDGWDDDER